MKISISYPPLKSGKGVPLLSQNRQFQWFNSPTYIYPVIPAYAATLLKKNGYDVMWDDGIAEELTYKEWEERIIQEKPDIIAIETKTPVVKKHWALINDFKEKTKNIAGWTPIIVLMGDHVTALPGESFEHCKVDYIIASGDYDFALLSLANHLNKKEELEGGFWYRDEKGAVVCTVPANIMAHSLDDLPIIDRKLTKWKNYAYKNGNFKYTPGTYMMSGRDCWWGRCTFCLAEDTQVLTVNGSKAIKEIKKGERVLTHLGNYKKVNENLKRNYTGTLVEIKAHCLIPFKITPNHKVLSLPKEELLHCRKTGLTGYSCKSNNNFSKRLDCENCSTSMRPYMNYLPHYVEAGQIKKGDYLALPINDEVIKKDTVDLREILNVSPTVIETKKKIKDSVITKILDHYKQGKSEREISTLLKIDRETVHRYIVLEKEGVLKEKINPIKCNGEKISFEGGKNWIPAEITLNNEVFRLFGYYLAEGCVSQLSSRPNSLVLSFTFSEKETEYIQDVENILKKNFKVGVNIHQNKINHTAQITVGNTLLAKVFKNLFGESCYDKKLPEFILKAEREKQVELLRGMFRGDAHYRKRGQQEEYILSSAADDLASQLVMVLLRCSAIPSVRKSKLMKKMTKPQNIITLSSIDIINLFEEKRSKILPKFIYKKGFIVGQYAYVPVINIKEENYKGIVYNLSVSKDHSYTANFVGVSNCSWVTFFPGKNYRTRSAKNALDEVGQLINLGVKEIMEDSGSLPIGAWLKEFCEGMIERGYNKKVVMSCNMRITGIKDLETWKLMKKAGFRFILFGLESANQETLDKIDKNLKVEEIEPGLKLCKQGGLEPHITVMMGYPWETKEMARNTIELAKKLFKKGYVDTLQATVLIPYPGTPLFKECQAKKCLTTEDWDDFDQRKAVMQSPLTEEDIKCFTQELYKSFVSPQFIFRKIIGIRSVNDIKFLIRAGFKVLGHLKDFGK